MIAGARVSGYHRDTSHMKLSPRSSLILLCALAAWTVPAAGEDSKPKPVAPMPGSSSEPTATPAPPVPASLAAPAGQVVSLTIEAKGVQIYDCRAKANGSGFEWVFKAPEAELFDAAGKKIGRHYAGPTWEMEDGGKVVGSVKAKADAPNGESHIPWLLLEVDPAKATGSLAQVRSIQRINTVGGVAPAAMADAGRVGQEVRVGYTATYKFFVAKP